ncbi:RNA polymerase sigma factor [Trinickia mobilis]|uniref:RNA polymerase sigma factor n=1 Tax=Trinickia mobilis TaxID=2816356 RepID=UPI001A8FF62C|nr:RNA polymerase sigma factor [Trinickia mobilis]
MKNDYASPHGGGSPQTSERQLDIADLAYRFGTRLYRFIARRVNSPSDVEDLVQVTYVEALRSLERFRGTAMPQTWLFGIAVNVVRHHRSRSPNFRFQFLDVAECLDLPADGADPAEMHALRETNQRLLEFLAALPKSTRQLVEFVCVDGLSYEDAAQRLDVPVGTVRSRLSRVRAKLREHLGDRIDPREFNT